MHRYKILQELLDAQNETEALRNHRGSMSMLSRVHYEEQISSQYPVKGQDSHIRCIFYMKVTNRGEDPQSPVDIEVKKLWIDIETEEFLDVPDDWSP